MRIRIVAALLMIALLLTMPLMANADATAEYVNDFSSGIGAASLFGHAVLDSGSVRLTDSVNGQQGSLVIDELFPLAIGIGNFTASFDVQIGPGGTVNLKQ